MTHGAGINREAAKRYTLSWKWKWVGGLGVTHGQWPICTWPQSATSREVGGITAKFTWAQSAPRRVIGAITAKFTWVQSAPRRGEVGSYYSKIVQGSKVLRGGWQELLQQNFICLQSAPRRVERGAIMAKFYTSKKTKGMAGGITAKFYMGEKCSKEGDRSYYSKIYF